MFIYGTFRQQPGEPPGRLDIQRSNDVTPEILQRAAENPDFTIINTRTRSYFVPDKLKPEGGSWQEIEPDPSRF